MIIKAIGQASLAAVNHVNEVINDNFFIDKIYYGYTLQQQLDDDRLKDSKQATQNLTKKIEPILNSAMRRVIEENGFGKSFETKGYDYIIEDSEVEFKACGSESVNQFATGGRSSAISKVKTNLTWILKYEFENNRISKINVTLIDLSKCNKSEWKAGNKSNHGFSGLKIYSEDINAIIPIIGSVDCLTKTGRFGATYVRANLEAIDNSTLF